MFSYQEIEEALELSENQVKVTLHRARKKLSGRNWIRSTRARLLSFPFQRKVYDTRGNAGIFEAV
ncbi:sigma factor-like helix-turn-helix DNA-binding protein [Mesobacillus boroniphilus]|uniref:sigma factor-like helix-turn-helix DNA-binding protein n=1 Tax=Mesobacillus boroniphilus TaxID=308892 RepID=UPI001E292809|nr:sigma factor-like helix-turn-helix DNA-binding protein [Mesobacillus boroniphilus]